MISIITATYNSERSIKRLVNSINSQTNKSFEWIIVDNKSSDSTLDIVKGLTNVQYKIISESDFGIYDAINKGIKASRYNYYLVVGSDDELFINAVEKFSASISDHPDAVTAKLYFGKKIMGVRGGSSLINKQFKYFSAHSVSTIFKKELHNSLGYYSSSFPIAADQLFMLKIANTPGANIKVIDDVVGRFNLGGVSSSDYLGTLTESLRIQLKFEKKYLCLLLYIFKLIKNIKKI
ncbi:glycosyltransferase [Parahaliea sp. F7430]|uniref:Glycosyltransferase n=1 Tax=Sediminihaliea albiluteola TaxID=2758564 RepID=A0A7W2YKT6_9GAMM|nr:glycosyltransferase [Sediminihaliea albiluteola]MBA6414064.1 glycosyltransferase [Sediminihaliea albiluteola]